ncbi:MAG TPA: NAD-dependent epimerase/dehydratase family protein [Terriglobales bacterium]|nr:NAD-dependent epimerase/dehydratase family protein [Terriglobales bacterium]
MKILVIGGSGFIGPPLIREFQQLGHTVAVFHRGTSPAPLPAGAAQILGDRNQVAAQQEEIRRFGPEIVIDLILSSGAQAKVLMDAMRGIARRVVAASSMDVYRACGVLHGSEPGPLEPLPLTEESPLRTKLQTYPPEVIQSLQTTFAWLDNEYDKIPVEREVLAHPELPGTVLRLPMVYGPGDKLHRFFPLLKRMDDGRQAIIFAQDLGAWRGMRGYVDNVASAIALAAVSEQAAGRIYNVAEEQTHSELEWARKIAHGTGWRGRFVLLPRERTPKHLLQPGNPAQHWVASSERIRRELGYREPVPTNEAIRRTIAWQRANPPAQIDPAQFDYAAEDAALAESAA